jgi:hypothetical protein
MRVILQQYAINKTAQYHDLPAVIPNTHLVKEAATLIDAVVGVDTKLFILTLG